MAWFMLIALLHCFLARLSRYVSLPVNETMDAPSISTVSNDSVIPPCCYKTTIVLLWLTLDSECRKYLSDRRWQQFWII